jgi:hypothetical protein
VERFTLAAAAFKGDQPERTRLNGTLEEAAARAEKINEF